MKKLNPINTFTEGDKVQGFYLCIDKHLRFTRSGDLYIDLELRDVTGHISAKIWDNVSLLNDKFNVGVTCHLMDKGIDTGDIILQSEIEIKEDDNFGSLYEKLKKKTGNFILTTLEYINNGVRKSQLVTTNLLSAPKLNKENTRINWSNSGTDICNQIKGLSPIPGAWSTLKQSKRNIKIYDAIFHKSVNNKECGEMFVLDKNKLMVIVNDGLIEIKKLQIEGKKKINANDFINGMKEKTVSYTHLTLPTKA